MTHHGIPKKNIRIESAKIYYYITLMFTTSIRNINTTYNQEPIHQETIVCNWRKQLKLRDSCVPFVFVTVNVDVCKISSDKKIYHYGFYWEISQRKMKHRVGKFNEGCHQYVLLMTNLECSHQMWTWTSCH